MRRKEPHHTYTLTMRVPATANVSLIAAGLERAAGQVRQMSSIRAAHDMVVSDLIIGASPIRHGCGRLEDDDHYCRYCGEAVEDVEGRWLNEDGDHECSSSASDIDGDGYHEAES